MRVYLVPDLVQPSPAVRVLATATFDSLVAVTRHLERELAAHTV
jgi:hypothetical protein